MANARVAGISALRNCQSGLEVAKICRIRTSPPALIDDSGRETGADAAAGLTVFWCGL